MNISGEMLIGSHCAQGTGEKFYAVNPATDEIIQPAFSSSSSDDIEQACKLAEAAFDEYRSLSLERRCHFLESIADEILALGDDLVQRAIDETGLPQMRIEGERGRTMSQLTLFTSVIRAGHWLDARIDPALPDREPLPRPDLRSRQIPLGPVAIFGASNFPLAFSVAGGDTASALAAGCPVIVKAHPAHPGTSELVGKAILSAAKKCEMPEGVFSLLFDAGHEIGTQIVAHPAIKAVGFTGSRAGGIALSNIAASRKEPIPVYAEMSSINPVFLLPQSLQQDAEALASGFVSSLTMGAGQFCTNPGLVVGLAGNDLNQFKQTANAELAQAQAQTMLTSGIHSAYTHGVTALSNNSAVSEVACGLNSDEPNKCQANLFSTSAKFFLKDPQLNEEVFGSAALVVECESTDEFIAVAEQLEGQLTATLQLSELDAELATTLLPVLERKVGRVLCNGYPTGVEVCHAMVHGGPFPATSDSRTSSVGSAAILRFLRPVSYQNLPEWLLPSELKNDNSLDLARLVDGTLKIG